MRSGRLALALLLAGALAAAGTLLVLELPKPRPRPGFLGSRPPAGLRAPDFALRDQSGALVRMRDLRGKVVLLTFLDTRCRDACPIIGEQMRAALAGLAPEERRRVEALAISVNPTNDTPEAVRAYLSRHRLVGGLRYLTGSERELRPVWEAFYVIASLDTGDADVHSAPVRIFDPRGIWVSTLRPEADLTPASLRNDVRAALAA